MITIEGMGWVTPLGRSLSGVWRQIAAEARPPLASQENPVNAHPAPIYRVPDNDVAEAAAHPRLRRSSRISHLALTAARDAISGLSPELLARTVLVFVASDGGVIYTRRFYADIVERGGGAGSPILFPETVYNAPASHVAAVLGLDAEVLTLVGDAATGIDGIATATEFLTLGEADRCLVVAAQELDWVTCEAYEKWRLTGPGRGAVFAEGAAALLLARDGNGPFITIPPTVFHPRLSRRLDGLIESFPKSLQLVSNSLSGSPLDAAERAALARHLPAARLLSPRYALGEALACSTLQQVIAAALALGEDEPATTAAVTAVGFNGLVAALFLTKSAREGNRI